MTEMIADLPLYERPRERMRKHGVNTLSDSELVAILLGSGTPGKNAIALARELLAGGLGAIAASRPEQLTKTNGIGEAKAARIAAALEIGRRLAAGEEDDHPDYVSDIVAQKLIIRCAGFRQEHLGAYFLDTRERIIGEQEIYVGTINHTSVSTREILRLSLEADAVGVVLYHNHPSGDPAPSSTDFEFTKRMAGALDLASLTLIDHLVIGKNRYISMKGLECY